MGLLDVRKYVESAGCVGLLMIVWGGRRYLVSWYKFDLGLSPRELFWSCLPVRPSCAVFLRSFSRPPWPSWSRGVFIVLPFPPDLLVKRGYLRSWYLSIVCKRDFAALCRVCLYSLILLLSFGLIVGSVALLGSINIGSFF